MQVITRESTVVASKDQVSSDLAGEAVILSLASAKYYGLDTVGSRIWQLVQMPTTIAAVRDAIMAEYEVDAERCEASIVRLLNELGEQGLVAELPATEQADSRQGPSARESGA